jgi:hypothetical protein
MWHGPDIMFGGGGPDDRAVMVQLGFYYHMRQAMGVASLAMTRTLAFALSFMVFVSIVIALFKDIPDIKGDRQVTLRRIKMGPGSMTLGGTTDTAEHCQTGTTSCQTMSVTRCRTLPGWHY